MASVAPPVHELIDRVKNLFIEVPGTQLSLAEISRLAGVEPPRCEAILDALISAGLLSRGRDGRFQRPS